MFQPLSKYSIALSPPPYRAQFNSLSNEEFNSLIKSLHLLRISQLRFIVQKYKIPANGNKTKLLNLMLSIFQRLRYEKILIEIYNEVNRLVSDRDFIDNHPANNLVLLDRIDNDFLPIKCDILYQYVENRMIFGPVLIQQGKCSGSFNFCFNKNQMVDQNNRVCMTFWFRSSCIQQFGMICLLNGNKLEVFQDDPYPKPIDITSFLETANLLELQVQTDTEIIISINEYNYIGIVGTINRICEKNIDLSKEKPMVTHDGCLYQSSFPLYDFLVKTIYGQDNWKCPFCQKTFVLKKLVLISIADNETENNDPQMVNFFEQQQNNDNDIFYSDWDLMI